MSVPTMRAVGISNYGPIENLESREVPKPPKPVGRELLVQVKGISVNPIDLKVRNGTYDDAPDYYVRVQPLTAAPPYLHIPGYDGAGVVLAAGDAVQHFRAGDAVYYFGSPVRPGAYAEQQLVDERHAGRKPAALDFVEAAALPLTYGTAREALVARLGIRPRERAALLVVNGGGGAGSIAVQIARRCLELPVVVATASRPETAAFARRMGATHVVDHRRGDLAEQVRAALREANTDDDSGGDIPLTYAFVTARTEQYIAALGEVMAPFGKVCSIVQARFDLYGTPFMSKSLTFVWCWIGTGPYHGYANDREEKHHEWYEELRELVDRGVIECHLTQRLRLTAEGIREAHRRIESGKAVGKIGLGVDEPGEGDPFS